MAYVLHSRIQFPVSYTRRIENVVVLSVPVNLCLAGEIHYGEFANQRFVKPPILCISLLVTLLYLLSMTAAYNILKKLLYASFSSREPLPDGRPSLR